MGTDVNKTAAAPDGDNLPEYRLAAKRAEDHVTAVRVGSAQVVFSALSKPLVIAGPCAVESEEQIQEAAAVAVQLGVAVLRGGCFKPRTSPYRFQGMGEAGLKLLCQAGKSHGIPVVAEVASAEELELALPYLDLIQVGARNMFNYPLLRAVGRAKRPVLLKRAWSATVQELLCAAEYILVEGNDQIILCERGIRTFERSTRNTLDIAAIPVLHQETHLPVIVDPSHAAGVTRLVAPLARAAMAVGADGLMIEFHPDPVTALSDREQALSVEEFKGLMGEIGERWQRP